MGRWRELCRNLLTDGAFGRGVLGTCRVVKQCDPTLIQPFVDGARELEREGVKAITTSCGFLAAFHPQITSSVNIPVFTSSLL